MNLLNRLKIKAPFLEERARRSHQQGESGEILIKQKQTTQELYILGNELNKPMKLLNLVFAKAGLRTSLASDVLKKIRKRNFEGTLQTLKSLKEVVTENSDLLIFKGMKANTITMLENSFDTITSKSNAQTGYQQQRKASTSANKGLYKELYVYISEVAKLGKIIFQGEQKASEYTIDDLIALLHSSQKKNSKIDQPE